MEKYNILKVGRDFDFVSNTTTTKGSRLKRIAIDKKTNEEIYFKYERYNCTESCSEKISYEIARVLGYPCAHIEFGEDEKGKIGILNYLFIKREEEEHDDAKSYINRDSTERKYFYTIQNIKNCLDKIDRSLFNDFLKIMVFDALVGETDRHEENWGIIKKNGKYKISPLYDNGCNLLREFKNEQLATQYYDEKKDFNSYIKRAKSVIYKDDHSRRYNLFELIEYLYQRYPNQIKQEIDNLRKLTTEKIEEITNKVPSKLLTEKHKMYIIIYLKKRKEILENIIKEKWVW